MADNTTLNLGSGGDVIATDDVGGVKYQRVKLDVGADGAAAPVSDSNPVPVSDAGGALTVDGTVAVTHAALTELGSAIDTEVQCDIVGALPAGTNNIGDVDVLSVVPGTSATSLGKAEDAAHSSGDVGVMALAVRQSTQSDFGADGDYVPLSINDDGELRVTSGSGGTSVADDADFTDGTTALNPIGGVYESTPSSVTDGDIGMAGITSTRALRVHISSTENSQTDDAAFTPASGLVSVIGAIVTADSVDSGDAGAVAMTTARALHTAVQSLPASTNTLEVVGDAAHDAAAAGNPLLVGAYASAAAPSDVSGDADAVRLWALRNGSLVVNKAIGGTLVTATTTQEVVGDVADDAATGGNPVLVAGVAVETDGTDPTTVSAEGDAAYLRTDRARRLLVSEHHPRSFFTSADYGAAQTNASVQAAPGASLSLYIQDIVISNGATAGNITLLDGSGGTVKFEIYPAINGGCAISLRQPIRLTANTALCITSTTVTTHSVNIGGYIAP